MRRLIALLLFLSSAHAEEGQPSVFTLLAEGKRAEAIAQLKGSQRPADLCLLGRLEALAGDQAAALATWARVPLDADCGWSATYQRADVLEKQGRVAEAAALYKQLGGVALGDAGEGLLVRWMTGLAREILKREVGYEDAFELLEQGLTRRVGAAGRLTLAKELAEASLKRARGYINIETQRILAQDKDPQTQHLLAQLLPAEAGYALLATLPPSEAITRLMAERALEMERGWGLAQIQALKAAPRPLRWRALEALLNDGRYSEALAYAPPLLEGQDDYARRASKALAELSLNAGHRLEAIALIEDHLKRFPSDEARPDLERRLNSARLALAQAAYEAKRFDEAITHAVALINRDPKAPEAPQAAYLAGLSAEAAGRPEEARARWNEAIARWPSRHLAYAPLMSLTRRAASAGELKGLLKRLESLGYNDIISELKAPWLFLETGQRQTPGAAAVRVLARNVKALEARVHRIDAEAFLRNGGRPEALAALDVAVIAPDRRWAVPLPEHKPHQVLDFPLPLNDLKPGYYRLTVSAEQREASVVVWISDARLIAQTAGAQIVAAVFKGSAPAPNARLLLHTSEGVKEAKTGPDGLYRGALPLGPVIVLAEVGEAPALLALDRDYLPPTPSALQIQADLDRYAYRPGDLVQFRIVARKDGAPVTGRWEITLDDGLEQRITLESSPWGTVSGALRISNAGVNDLIQGGGVRRALRLMVKPEGQEQVFTVGQGVVLPAAPRMQLNVEVKGEAGLITLRDAHGAPVEGAAVNWGIDVEGEDKTSRTDARGQIRVQGPKGLTYRLSATYQGLRAEATQAGAGWPALRLELAREEIAPGEAPLATLKGVDGFKGEVQIRLSYASVPAAPKQPEDPLTLKYKQGFELLGFKQAYPTHHAGGEHTLYEGRIKLDGSAPLPLTLPALAAEGQYTLRAVSLNQQAYSAQAHLYAFKRPLALRGLSQVRAGEALRLSVEGEQPALTLIRGREGVLAAQLLKPGEALTWVVDPALERVHFSAYTADGQAIERLIYPSRALKVTLTPTTAGPWGVEARVEDPTGQPTEAEVVLVIDDEGLNQRLGHDPDRIEPRLFAREGDAERVGGLAASLSHGAEAQEIAQALQEEAMRRREAMRARNAQRGDLQDNRFAEVMQEERQMIQLGNMGISGSGRGGGGVGYGRGRGQLAHMHAQMPTLIGAPDAMGDPAPIFWRVGRTSVDGVLKISHPLPPLMGRYRLYAAAVNATSFGTATTPLKNLDARVWLHVRAPSAGHPGAAARLWPQIINNRDVDFDGALEIDGAARPIKVVAGQALRLDLGLKAPGAAHTLKLRGADGAIIDEARWRFPLISGVPKADGEILEVAFAPGGGFPTLWLAQRHDPLAAGAPIRAARAGAALLVALPYAPAAERPALIEALRGYAITAREFSGGEHEAAAEVIHFLLDASALLGISKRSLTALQGHLEDPSPQARLAVAYARARLGQPPSKALLSRLAQIPEGDDEASARYARLLIALDQRDEAKRFAKGDGPHGILARAALGEDVTAARARLRQTPPPLPGAAEGAVWLAATASPSPNLEGQARLLINGVEIQTLPLGPGGQLRRLIAPTDEVKLEGGGQALTLRSAPAIGEAPRLSLERVPLDDHGNTLALCDTPPPCGDAARPCLASVGEQFKLNGVLKDEALRLPAGLRPAAFGGVYLTAEIPGDYRLTGLKGEAGLTQPIHIRVMPKAPRVGEVCQEAALALAQEAAKLGEDPEPYLQAWGRDEAWGHRLPWLTRLRFERAKAGTAAQLVEAFEALRAADNNASLSFDEMARIAIAYADSGRPDRALDVWRAGLSAAFKDESASIQESQRYVGELPVLKALRQAADRYPDLPQVDEALCLLPQLIADLAEGALSPALKEADVTPTDLKLMSAAWARALLLTRPKHDKHAELGFQLTQLLLDLNAPARAAAWARRISEAHPKSTLLDGLLYLEALARSQLRQDEAAFALFKRLSEDQFPIGDEEMGPAPSKGDALYAMGRLYEAKGDLKAAKVAYRASTGVPEAAQAADALERVELRVAPLLKIKSEEALKLEVTASNVEEIDLRAYRLDLRTLFIRDKGLGDPNQILVDGLQPIWSDTRQLKASPFPQINALEIPLNEPGAYLVRVMGAGRSSTALIIRSDLEIIPFQQGRKLYVRARRGGAPVTEAFVRGANSGGVEAKTTDLRGVAVLSAGMNVLVIDGAHIAVESAQTINIKAPNMPSSSSGRFEMEFDAADEDGDAMQRNIKMRYKKQIKSNKAKFKRDFNNKNNEVLINAF
ncbi:hypothetical protein KJ940_14890 [Myxococcota bacterium]|nr:hypothetical protein [Myxococcota bacterium]